MGEGVLRRQSLEKFHVGPVLLGLRGVPGRLRDGLLLLDLPPGLPFGLGALALLAAGLLGLGRLAVRPDGQGRRHAGADHHQGPHGGNRIRIHAGPYQGTPERSDQGHKTVFDPLVTWPIS